MKQILVFICLHGKRFLFSAPEINLKVINPSKSLRGKNESYKVRLLLFVCVNVCVYQSHLYQC